jgi:uncharacterized protein (TIGR00369 family)
MAAAVTTSDINDLMERRFGPTELRCTDVGERHAIAETRPGPTSLRPGQIISGPSVFGLADAVLMFAIYGAVGVEHDALTSEMSIRYLRPARGDVLNARADLHSVGGRSVVGSVVLWTGDQDRPVAVAQGTYVRITAAR